MNGKGSAPRPYSVSRTLFADAWARTFATPHPVRLTSTDLSVDCDTLRHVSPDLPGGDLRLPGVYNGSDPSPERYEADSGE